MMTSFRMAESGFRGSNGARHSRLAVSRSRKAQVSQAYTRKFLYAEIAGLSTAAVGKSLPRILWLCLAQIPSDAKRSTLLRDLVLTGSLNRLREDCWGRFHRGVCKVGAHRGL